ncbi:SnoaL-like domain-containing protein [Tsuneonella troitsensis]|uniref:SnoaL-like domain-containing protein n=1 Tax=Tsuneonella troitsensis TaxID=292222 RepID=UPI00070F1008|nr:SnoaL-like domain-containing protein [Tsuneonella troitsensis]
MTAIDVIAGDFTAMLRAGRFEDAGEKYWASDVVSIEPADLPGGIRASVTGIDAARIKCDARFGSALVDEIGIDGPFVTGDQFALFLDLVTLDPLTGERRSLTEIALNTVRDNLIAEERHFYD